MADYQALNKEDLKAEVALATLSSALSAMASSEHRSLSVRQLAILMLCARSPQPMTPAQISAALNLSPPVVSIALSRLEMLDYITRDANPTDRRSLFVRIEEAGWRFIDRAIQR